MHYETSDDQYIENMLQFFQKDNDIEISPAWYKIDHAIHNLQQVSAQFHSFTKINKNNANTTFVITSFSQGNKNEKAVGNLLLYSKHDNNLTSFVPPCKPNIPIVKDVHEEKVTLSCTWNAPHEEHFDVTILYSEQSDDWRQCKFESDDSKCHITVHDLKPYTNYCFKVLAEYKYGMSEPSEVSEVVTTKSCYGKPGKPVLKNQ